MREAEDYGYFSPKLHPHRGCHALERRCENPELQTHHPVGPPEGGRARARACACVSHGQAQQRLVEVLELPVFS